MKLSNKLSFKIGSVLYHSFNLSCVMYLLLFILLNYIFYICTNLYYYLYDLCGGNAFYIKCGKVFLFYLNIILMCYVHIILRDRTPTITNVTVTVYTIIYYIYYIYIYKYFILNNMIYLLPI